VDWQQCAMEVYAPLCITAVHSHQSTNFSVLIYDIYYHTHDYSVVNILS